MNRTTLKQRIFLMILGIFLTLVLLEVGLRVGGGIFTARQSQRNKVLLQEDGFRILCIGESTTALGGTNSYPSQLEAILKERNPGKSIKVINAGQVSKGSWHLFDDLENNLKEYQPHLVIAMIGINDFSLGSSENDFYFKINNLMLRFRTYKLLRLLKDHIRSKVTMSFSKLQQEEKSSKDIMNPLEKKLLRKYDIDEIDEDDLLKKILKDTENKYKILKSYYIGKSQWEKKKIEEQLDHLGTKKALVLCRLANFYYVRDKYQRAEYFLKEAISSKPDFYVSYLQLGKIYVEKGHYHDGLGLIKKSRELRPDSTLVLMELGHCYSAMGEKSKAAEVYQIVISTNPENVWFFSEIAKWFKDNNYDKESEDIYVKAIEKNPGDPTIYNELAEIYLKQGRTKEARKIYNKARHRGGTIYLYSPMTTHYYNKIAKSIVSRNIGLICMQYPLRAIKSLKDALRVRDGVLFVENKENFEGVLEQSQYSKYFLDSFAGDFGHCTHEGNRLIAQNLADVIEREILDKNQFISGEH